MATNTPTILVDLDGVLNMFDDHFWSRCTENGWEFDIENRSDQTKRWFSDHIISKQDKSAARKMINQPGWFRDIPVMPGAQEGMDALASLAEVWIVTKPLETNPTCLQDKQDWISEYFPDFKDRLFIAPDKSLVKGDYLLDDAPKPKWFSRAEWKPIIYTQPFNSHEDSIYYRYHHFDWSMGVKKLFELINPLIVQTVTTGLKFYDKESEYQLLD